MSGNTGDQNNIKKAPSAGELSAMEARIEALAKAHQNLSAELTSDNKRLRSWNSPADAGAVERKLVTDGFPSFSLDKNGDIISSPGATAADRTPVVSDASPTTAPASESDLINVVTMVASKADSGFETSSGFNVSAANFNDAFGSEEAASMKRLGLTNVSLQNDHLTATFAKPGGVSFGDQAVNYSSTVKMDYANANGTMKFSDISGITGPFYGLTAKVSEIDIAPVDPSTVLSDVKAKAHVGLLGKTVDAKVAIEPEIARA